MGEGLTEAKAGETGSPAHEWLTLLCVPDPSHRAGTNAGAGPPTGLTSPQQGSSPGLFSQESDHHSIPLALSVSPGARGILKCRCASIGCIPLLERNQGSCFQGRRVYTFCCRRVK
ncbi:hypothetical protein H1C71_040530 [Ictidomys tridecemlineatus]|nr:hypothetical protein H1C71_040530 [Ictidomys tridecemlineatus]